MATYDPPQPMWKRSVASVLDFVLALLGFGYVVSKILGVKSEVPDMNGELVTTFELGKGPPAPVGDSVDRCLLHFTGSDRRDGLPATGQCGGLNRSGEQAKRR
jgi:hypothetical protein